jgi:molybdopterin-guanine dinucleotide biosynthesis protein MobB
LKRKDGIPYLGFVGHSGSGKTTLLIHLIPELKRRGYDVAVVKYTHHRHVETDLPGKDTRRLWDAGAAHTAFLAQDRVVHTHRYASPPSLEEALVGIHDVDLVLVEGYKGGDYPKVEVVRRANHPASLPNVEGRVACITDVGELPWEGPRLALDDVGAVADFVEAWLSTVKRTASSHL